MGVGSGRFGLVIECRSTGVHQKQLANGSDGKGASGKQLISLKLGNVQRPTFNAQLPERERLVPPRYPAGGTATFVVDKGFSGKRKGASLGAWPISSRKRNGVR